MTANHYMLLPTAAISMANAGPLTLFRTHTPCVVNLNASHINIGGASPDGIIETVFFNGTTNVIGERNLESEVITDRSLIKMPFFPELFPNNNAIIVMSSKGFYLGLRIKTTATLNTVITPFWAVSFSQ